MLVAASIGIFVFTLIVNRMQREAQKAAIHAQELGQYKLEIVVGFRGKGESSTRLSRDDAATDRNQTC